MGMVPGHKQWGFFTPPMCLPSFCAAFVAGWIRGAFLPVDLRVVCFILAIVQLLMFLFYLCSCVCVFAVWCSLTGKKGESVMTPNFNNENLNHPFTGTSLHMVASKSTPERIEVSCQIGIHSVLTSSYRTVLAFPQKSFCSNIWHPLTWLIVSFCV